MYKLVTIALTTRRNGGAGGGGGHHAYTEPYWEKIAIFRHILNFSNGNMDPSRSTSTCNEIPLHAYTPPQNMIQHRLCHM